MRISVSNQIVVKDYDLDTIKWCHDNLVLPNPEFYKKERLGKWTGGTPKDIYLYERNGNDLILPFGCLNHMWQRYKNKCPFDRQIQPLRAFNYKTNINLYGYQEKAVNEALRLKNGVLVMPCGAGKTQTALEIIARVGGRALWLTHTQDLLNQSMNRAKAVYDIDFKSLGTITGGKVNVGTSVTFATVQTMAKLNLKNMKDYWDVIVVDECHKAIGSPTKVMQFYKVISSLSCRYKFGLTATPKRADGLSESMYALLGEKIVEVTKEEVKHTTCDVDVLFIDTGYIPDPDKILMADGTINYASLTDELITDKNRFVCVLDTLKSLPTNHPVIVLGNRVEYLKRMCDAYNQSQAGTGICLSGMSASKASREERKKALAELNNCDIDCIFATYQLAKEGLDVPNLRYVVFATPEKDETTVTQAAGRVARKFEGKEKGTVIDFIDNFGMYRGWAKKREKYYKKLDYKLQ